jgi:hypothetical protein
VHTRFWWGHWRERYHLEDFSINGRILKWLLRKWGGGQVMDWIDLAQDRWLVFVSVLMNIQVPHNAGIFLTS